MNILRLIFVYLIAVCSFSFATELKPNTTVEDPPRGCSIWDERGAQNITAYFGWPLIISFSRLVDHIKGLHFFRFLDFEKETAICTVRLASTGEVLQNVSVIYSDGNLDSSALRLPDVSEETHTAFILIFKLHDLCGYQKIRVIKENAPVVYKNCSSAIDSRHFGVVHGKFHRLICGGDKELNFLSAATNLTYKWIYNCDKEVNYNFPRDGNELKFINTSFSFMGQYLCIVEYKDQRLPAVKYDICVKHAKADYPNVEPKCDVPKTRLGDDVTIICSAGVQETKANNLFIGAEWYKDGIEICIDPAKNPSIGKYNCSSETSIQNRGCYDTMPVPKAEVDIYTVYLTIKSVNRSDFGEYQLEYKWDVQSKIRINVTLEEDITKLLQNQIIGISIGTVFVFLIILFLLFCLFRKNDVAWFMKKHFGPYEKEPFSYAAFFVYYYDSTDKISLEMTTMKNLVEGLHEYMNKFGGTVYDEIKDPNIVPSDAENIKLVAGDCHRIIVMISPGFVKDKWSQYRTNTALTEAVETGKKVIFVTIPGTKDAIQNQGEESRKTLQSAMKRNITVEWNGKMPFSGSFCRRMEYGLPKLPRPVYSRYMSDSSQIQLTYQNKHT